MGSERKREARYFIDCTFLAKMVSCWIRAYGLDSKIWKGWDWVELFIGWVSPAFV